MQKNITGYLLVLNSVKERYNLQPINIAQEIAGHNSVLLKAPVANILVGYMHSPQGVANDIVDLLKNPNRKNL